MPHVMGTPGTAGYEREELFPSSSKIHSYSGETLSRIEGETKGIPEKGGIPVRLECHKKKRKQKRADFSPL